MTEQCLTCPKYGPSSNYIEANSVMAILCSFSSGEGEIRCEQMNMVTKWISEFQAASGRSDEDVAFDVLCGDFNFDNCSPGV